MIKPPQELIDIFFKWYKEDVHSKNEDYYHETITLDYLSGLSKYEFIDFFYNFAHEGGRVQSLGQITSKQFRQTMENKYEQFRPFMLSPFETKFDEVQWLNRIDDFKYLGKGLATIYLNRVDKKRFPILNNKTSEALELFDVKLPSNIIKQYKAVQESQQQLIDWFPELENFFRVDALCHFLAGEDDGKKIQHLIYEKSGTRYWLYAPGENAKYWDECWDNGLMIFGTDELEDLNTYDSKIAIEEALKKARGLKTKPTNDALAAWEFSRRIKPGDVIIAKKGSKQYIGYGIVTGPYVYDGTRETYRNTRNVRWVKRGEWNEEKGPIVQKTLTDITKYPEYVEKLKKIIGIENIMPSLNTILYGPPGTGKTWKLRTEYMDLFTDTSATLSKEEYAASIVSDLAWWKVIAMVMMDLKESRVSDIMTHPLMQARIKRSSSVNPRAAIWAHIQMHTKEECQNVKYTKRYEPLLYEKDDKSVWSIDLELAEEAVPELKEKLEEFNSFEPGKQTKIERYDFTTFHQSFSYEDFVEGIKPVMPAEDATEEVPDSLSYEVRPGIFKKMVQRALADPKHDYALFIDEINRGNVASIFGELITLIEEDKRQGAKQALTATLPYSQTQFVVPKNLYIIGAMNTADRSVEALDTALRRRFTFIAVPPEPGLLPKVGEVEGLSVDLQKMLHTINARIQKLLDRDHCIGHSYFLGVSSFEDLQIVFATKILPLLEEYFYGDPARIGMVLGEKFVWRNDESVNWAQGDWGQDGFDERNIYVIKDPRSLSQEDFKSIYE
jgi:hypothetical protein